MAASLGPPEPIFSTNQLSAAYSTAADFQHAAGGMLAVILSVDDPWILLWFNAEQIETVNWAGNPHKDRSNDLTLALTAWAETVSGRARASTLPELDAAMRLRAALLDVQQNRRVHQLNQQLTALVRDKDLLLQQRSFWSVRSTIGLKIASLLCRGSCLCRPAMQTTSHSAKG
jgi:chemotaxis family two-component system sensor kinase Cph1